MLYGVFLRLRDSWIVNVCMILIFIILFFFTSGDYSSAKFHGMFNAVLMSSFYYLFLVVTLVNIGVFKDDQDMAKRNIRIMIGFVCAWVSTDMIHSPV